MVISSSTTKESHEQPDVAITGITVAGYKSVRDEQTIEVQPLTILAGANCSGKSSIMQPLLLLKQTLESSYDAGPLLLNGPNVQLTNAEQLLSRRHSTKTVDRFHIGLKFGKQGQTESDLEITTYFEKKGGSNFDVWQTSGISEGNSFTYKKEMSDQEEIRKQLLEEMKNVEEGLPDALKYNVRWEIVRERCFLYPSMTFTSGKRPMANPSLSFLRFLAAGQVQALIHVPALRSHRERTYPKAAVKPMFSGTFQDYVGSIIAQWQDDKNQAALNGLNEDLQLLGLSWTVKAEQPRGGPVEIQVGRLPRIVQGSARDLVNIADVGVGVSQVLPVLVALHVAQPDQLIYFEEPEIHLHPQAQVAMARVLAKAVKHGVRMVVETHSRLLLLALQTLVADGTISPNMIKLHWFTRSEIDGTTTITSADLDDAGAFGDWPEDFGSVEMGIESSYLDAAEAKVSSA